MSAIGLVAFGVGLAGCGQRGPLYLPTDPAAANRATLPQTIIPGLPRGQSSTPGGSSAVPPAADTRKTTEPAAPSSSPSESTSGNAPSSGAAR